MKVSEEKLFNHLKSISIKSANGDYYYVNKDNCKFVSLAKEVGMTRQTVSKIFNNLCKNGFLLFNDELNAYEIVDDNYLKELSPHTIKVLKNTVSDDSFFVLSYLIRLWFTNRRVFSSDSLGKKIVFLDDILTFFKLIGIIEYHQEDCLYYLDNINLKFEEGE